MSLVGGENEDKFKAMWNVHSNPLHCHGGERLQAHSHQGNVPIIR